jgi:hypothetical protein
MSCVFSEFFYFATREGKGGSVFQASQSVEHTSSLSRASIIRR